MKHDEHKRRAFEAQARPKNQATLRIEGLLSGDSTIQVPSPADTTPVESSDRELGRKYVVLERVADGGMGVLYLAQDRQLGRFVAVKRLNPRTLGNASMKRRMMQEAKVVAALRHPNIVHIYELGEDDEGPYIVMEYVSGPPDSSPHKTPTPPFSLADRVHRNGSIEVGEALSLIIKIARAVEHAHRCGVIHRDLKPSNILYDDSMEPKVVDFGLARAPQRSGVEPLTLPGERFLSLGYGAPEQEHDASRTDERADVYGLGALLFFSLTGQNPRFFRPDDVPDELRMPILKALEPDKEKRWTSVSEFLETLLVINTPDVAGLPSVRRTWRCKWCDTVNPVSIRYCGKCGWDGGETCVECNSETRAGVPFCGHCGADLRDYEAAVRLHRALQAHWRKQEYRQIVEKVDGISGFTPIGAAGKKIVDEALDLKALAEKTLKRVDQLQQLIPFDISSGAYLRARRHIEEYNSLADDDAFCQEAGTLHTLMVERYLETARISIERRRWSRAIESCNAVLDGLDPTNETARKLMGRLKVRRTLYEIRMTTLFAALFFFGYLFSAAPVSRLLGATEPDSFRMFYRFAGLVQSHSFLQQPLRDYASMWGVPGLLKPRADVDDVADVVAVVPPEPAENRLMTMKQEYRESLNRIEEEFADKALSWPSQYVKKLMELKTTAQRLGDYEAWERTQLELLRFDAERRITISDYVEIDGELSAAQKQFLSSWNAFKQKRDGDAESLKLRYVENLKVLRRNYTKSGEMDLAELADQEVDRLEALSAESDETE